MFGLNFGGGERTASRTADFTAAKQREAEVDKSHQDVLSILNAQGGVYTIQKDGRLWGLFNGKKKIGPSYEIFCVEDDGIRGKIGAIIDELVISSTHIKNWDKEPKTEEYVYPGN